MISLATTAAADIKMAEILTRIDQFVNTTGVAADAARALRPDWPLAAGTPRCLDLKDERIDTVIWATGYRRAYPWLRLPIFDFRGEIMHKDGITPEEGSTCSA